MIKLNSPLKPDLKKVLKYLESINNNGWYSNFGPLHNELTARLESYLNVENLLLVNNGTSALQVAGRALGSNSLISTPFSFVATVSAFKWQKDDIVFSDIDRNTYNLCSKEVDKAFHVGCKADTILATHVYGNPCDVENFERIACKHKVKVIYDAAHAFGINVENKSVLSFGDASTLSFHATKVFHTIEGGAIVFKEKDRYEKAKNIINFGIHKGEGITDVGLNAKLSEYHAAVGLVNLDAMEDIIDHRANLFYQYRELLKDIVEIPFWHPEANANGAYMPIKLKNSAQLQRVGQVLSERGIESRHYFSPSLDKVFVCSFSYPLNNAHHISKGILCVPMHAYMKSTDVETVVSTIKKGL